MSSNTSGYLSRETQSFMESSLQERIKEDQNSNQDKNQAEMLLGDEESENDDNAGVNITNPSLRRINKIGQEAIVRKLKLDLYTDFEDDDITGLGRSNFDRDDSSSTATSTNASSSMATLVDKVFDNVYAPKLNDALRNDNGDADDTKSIASVNTIRTWMRPKFVPMVTSLPPLLSSSLNNDSDQEGNNNNNSSSSNGGSYVMSPHHRIIDLNGYSISEVTFYISTHLQECFRSLSILAKYFDNPARIALLTPEYEQLSLHLWKAPSVILERTSSFNSSSRDNQNHEEQQESTNDSNSTPASDASTNSTLTINGHNMYETTAKLLKEAAKVANNNKASTCTLPTKQDQIDCICLELRHHNDQNSTRRVSSSSTGTTDNDNNSTSSSSSVFDFEMYAQYILDAACGILHKSKRVNILATPSKTTRFEMHQQETAPTPKQDPTSLESYQEARKRVRSDCIHSRVEGMKQIVRILASSTCQQGLQTRVAESILFGTGTLNEFVLRVIQQQRMPHERTLLQKMSNSQYGAPSGCHGNAVNPTTRQGAGEVWEELVENYRPYQYNCQMRIMVFLCLQALANALEIVIVSVANKETANKNTNTAIHETKVMDDDASCLSVSTHSAPLSSLAPTRGRSTLRRVDSFTSTNTISRKKRAAPALTSSMSTQQDVVECFLRHAQHFKSECGDIVLSLLLYILRARTNAHVAMWAIKSLRLLCRASSVVSQRALKHGLYQGVTRWMAIGELTHLGLEKEAQGMMRVLRRQVGDLEEYHQKQEQEKMSSMTIVTTPDKKRSSPNKKKKKKKKQQQEQQDVPSSVPRNVVSPKIKPSTLARVCFQRYMDYGKLLETTIKLTSADESMAILLKRLQARTANNNNGITRFTPHEREMIRSGQMQIVFGMPQIGMALSREQFCTMAPTKFIRLTAERPIRVDIQTRRTLAVQR